MKQRKGLTLALYSIFLIVFNVIYYMAGGTDYNVAAWIGYAFIHVSYAMLILTTFCFSKGAVELDMPTYTISVAYFLVDFVLGLLFILISPKSYKFELALQIIVLGIYFVLLIINLMANDATREKQAVQGIEKAFIKDSSNQLKGIMEQATDPMLRKKIEQAYDFVHASPSKSNSMVMDMEVEVRRLIRSLEQAVATQDIEGAQQIVTQIITTMNSRNRTLSSQA